MDVESLYPSIDIEFSVDRCCELILDSEISFEQVDTDELGLFLALTVTNERLTEIGINKFCPVRRNTRSGRPPTLTASGTDPNHDIRWRPWVPSPFTPDETSTRVMVVEAINISIKTTMKNHVFQFNQKYYKQQNGGAIGVGVAGEVANLFMVYWERQLLERMVGSGMLQKLYSRYVDDIEVVVKSVKPGSETEEKETMEKIQQIANDIHPSIRVTIDYPSNHTDGRMPVLDITQRMEIIDGKPQIVHSHYMKPMSNRNLINSKSAQSDNSKLNILAADLLRVMRNVSNRNDESERKKWVQHFMNRMQFSGYNQSMRMKVYHKAKMMYQKRQREDEEGTKPFYRAKTWNRDQRNKQGLLKKKNWFAKGGYETVMFIDATPDSELAESCRRVLKQADLKIRVVERSGVSLKHVMVKSNPFPRVPCRLSTCGVCSNTDKINCKKRDVIYEVACNGCNAKYIGETARSIGERFNEHLGKYNSNSLSSVFHEHMREKHDSTHQQLNLKIMASYPGDAMLRQTYEATSINALKPILNRKEEFGNSNVPRRRQTEND